MSLILFCFWTFTLSSPSSFGTLNERQFLSSIKISSRLIRSLRLAENKDGMKNYLINFVPTLCHIHWSRIVYALRECLPVYKDGLAPLFVMLKIVTTIKTDNPLIHSSFLRDTSAPEENAWRKILSWLFFSSLFWKSWGDDLFSLEQYPLIGSFLIISYCMFSFNLPWKS